MASKSTKEENGDSGLESTSTSSLSSSTSNEQMPTPRKKRKMDVFYERYADGTFRFADGRTLKASMTFLAAKSGVFEERFRGSAPEYIIDVQDFDLATFKLFLDSLLGFRGFTVEDVLLIFPIAWKYETEQFIEKCLEVLQPSVLNENVCLTLNIGSFCKCGILIDSVLKFLEEKFLIYRLLDEEKYYNLLEPESMCQLLNYIDLDSSVLTNLINWGKHYLEKHDKPIALKTFFTETKIIDSVTSDLFETAGSLLQFIGTDIGKEFFTNADLGSYVREYEYDKRPVTWVKVEGGTTLTERFILKNVVFMENCVTKVHCFRNRVIFFELPDDQQEKLVTYDIFYSLVDYDTEDAEKRVYESSNYSINRRSALRGKRASFDSFEVHDVISDVKVKVQINFKYDCRIMKSQPKNFVPVDSDAEGWFFFSETEIEYEKIE